MFRKEAANIDMQIQENRVDFCNDEENFPTRLSDFFYRPSSRVRSGKEEGGTTTRERAGEGREKREKASSEVQGQSPSRGISSKTLEAEVFVLGCVERKKFPLKANRCCYKNDRIMIF